MANLQVKPVRVRARVPADPGRVFEFVADTRNDPVWCPNVDTAEIIAGDAVAVGSRFSFSQHLDRPGGRRLEFDAEVEITELGESSIGWLVKDRFQERQISIDVEPDPAGSMVTQVTTARFLRDPGLVTRLAYPIIARRTLKDQLSHLAAHFED